MTSPQDLSDIEAIKQLKARYCLLLDTQDWAGLSGLFLEEATFDIDKALYPNTRAFIDEISVGLADELHLHIAHMPIIELTRAGFRPRALDVHQPDGGGALPGPLRPHVRRLARRGHDHDLDHAAQ